MNHYRPLGGIRTCLLALAALLLAAGGSLARPIPFTTGTQVYGNVPCNLTRYTYPHWGLRVWLWHRQSDAKMHTLMMWVGTGGRSGEIRPSFKGAHIAEFWSAWEHVRDDGSSVAGASFGLSNDAGEGAGVFLLRAFRLPRHPGWTFIQLRTLAYGEGATPVSGAPALLTAFTLDSRMGSLPVYRHPRVMFVAWPGESARGGDEVPWDRKQPDFNALAIYGRGLGEEAGSELLVFDPTQLASLSLLDWHYGYPRICLGFTLRPTNEIAFALGGAKEENGEHVAVPRFLENEREVIAEALRTMDWEVTVDRAPLDKLLAQVRTMLEAAPPGALHQS